VVVVDHEDVDAAERLPLLRRCGDAFGPLERAREPEGAPAPDLAFNPDLAPMSSTSCLLMAKPSPVPPVRAESFELSACVKLSKISERCAASIPTPVSVTLEAHKLRATRVRSSIDRFRQSAKNDLSGLGELDRVAEQIQQDLRTRTGSPRTSSRRPGCTMTASSSPFSSAP